MAVGRSKNPLKAAQFAFPASPQSSSPLVLPPHNVPYTRHGANHYIWFAICKADKPGAYVLSATDPLQHPAETDSVIFSVDPSIQLPAIGNQPAATDTHNSGQPVFQLISLTVQSPASSDDISADKDYFVAYGPISQNAILVTATMNNVNADCIYTDSDGAGNYFWTAQFPPLSDGTYTLFVADNTGGTNTAANLSVLG
jgi:hypothetical protein